MTEKSTEDPVLRLRESFKKFEPIDESLVRPFILGCVCKLPYRSQRIEAVKQTNAE